MATVGERVGQLYDALADPNVTDKKAREYMAEYRSYVLPPDTEKGDLLFLRGVIDNTALDFLSIAIGISLIMVCGATSYAMYQAIQSQKSPHEKEIKEMIASLDRQIKVMEELQENPDFNTMYGTDPME